MDDITTGTIMREIHENPTVNHRFGIGDMVRLSRTGPLRNAAPGLYQIVAQRRSFRSGRASFSIALRVSANLISAS